MDLDPLLLSRLQFAWVIAWHIVLPAFTIGVASYIALLEAVYAWTKKPVFLRVSKFWIRLFAVTFGIGVVSGIVMPFQLGTNWSRFTEATGNVLGPLFAYEGLTAFFLEAGFLGVLLFGRKLVPQWAHVFAAFMVALGTLFSTFWIIAVNSWMQTPSGHVLHNGQFLPADWSAVIFSPSFPYRLMHTVAAFYVTTAFVVLGIGAYIVRAGRFIDEGRLMVRMALGFLTIMVPLQIVLGDLQGLNTLEHQPVKLAAMEGLWEGGTGVPASLIGVPDEEGERNHFEIAVPRLGSLYLTHQWDGVVKGLKDFPREDWPPVMIVYFSFRIMVACGLVMLAVVSLGWLLLWRRRLFNTGYLRLVQWLSPIGFIAILAGWTTTEVGRQPWTVYGLLRTADSVTPSLSGGHVLASLLGYVTVYLLVYPAGFVLLRRIVRNGPLADDPQADIAVEAGRPKGPIVALGTREPS